MKVLVATPCYGAAATTFYVHGIFDIAHHFTKLGMDIGLDLMSESLITRARNRIVARFLRAGNYTHLFFIDADIGHESMASAMGRLLLADRDVAVGVYPLKRDYSAYPVNSLIMEDGRIRADNEGFAEVSEATTGFMCIKAGVFQKMMEAYPELQYTPEEETDPEFIKHHWLFFDTLHDKQSRRYLSEDYAFCKRWRDIGGKVYVDLYSKFKHVGVKVWEGDFLAHLKGTIQMQSHTDRVLNGEYDLPYDHPSPVILDVGANVGAFAVWAKSKWPKATVHCYEPHPDAMQLLEVNTADFGTEVTHHKQAVGEEGLRKLYQGKTNIGESSLYKGLEQQDRFIVVDCLDPNKLPKADILKLDVEGAEIEILSRLEKIDYDAILLEYHSEDNRRTIDRLLEDYVLVRSEVVNADRGTLRYIHRRLVNGA